MVPAQRSTGLRSGVEAAGIEPAQDSRRIGVSASLADNPRSPMPVANLTARLPEVEVVRAWSQSLAVLDAILSPRRDFRYFTFDALWKDEEELASMHNGSCDEYSIVFAPEGAFIRGFYHESEMSPFGQRPPTVWPGVVDQVPPELQRFVTEPSFSNNSVPLATVCLWRLGDDNKWRHGDVTLPTGEEDPDGADWLFGQLDGRPESYRDYALEYFERGRSTSPPSMPSTVTSHSLRSSFQASALT